jgi:hypothetical protein
MILNKQKIKSEGIEGKKVVSLYIEERIFIYFRSM